MIRDARTSALCIAALTLAGCAKLHSDTLIDDRAVAHNGGATALPAAGTTATAGRAGIDSPMAAVSGRPADVAGQTGSAGGRGGADSATNPDQAGAVATSNHVPEEVWVGQLWSVGQVLCDPLSPWSDRKLFVTTTGFLDRAVLVLAPDSEGHIGGRVQFGQGTVPTDPGAAPYADGDNGTFWLCSTQIPTTGAEYTLLNVARTAARVSFELAPNEIWSSWCRTQIVRSDGCDCEGRDCHATTTVRFHVDLIQTDNTLEGELPLGAAIGTLSQLRLRRVQ
jgi:hypothetical protein